MSIKSLQKLKKKEAPKPNKIFFPTIVLGEDLFSLSAMQRLWQHCPTEDVAFICARQLDDQDFEALGPNSLRGEENLNVFEEIYPQVKLEKQTEVASFYKESQLRSFAGRTKPEPLLAGEGFYIAPRADFNTQELFSSINEEEFKTKLAENTIQLMPVEIKRYQSDDLIEKGRWKITCSNGQEYLCEQLVFGRSPAAFLDLYKDKSDLSAELIEVCEKTQTPCSLIIRLEYDKKVCEREESLFLPLSFTYEWGHFIGEFSAYNEASKKQVGEFIHFINKNEASEDEISKKIRLLKRNLEKNFPQIKGAKLEEFIFLKEESACLNFDNLAFQKIQEEIAGVHFVGVNAYFDQAPRENTTCEDSTSSVSHLTRGLASLHALEKFQTVSL